MGASVRPEADPVAAYNAKYGGPQKSSAGPDPVTAYNAKYGAPEAQPPMAQKIAETIVSGFPGADRAVAGYRGLVSLFSGPGASANLATPEGRATLGRGMDTAADEVNSAMSGQKKDVASMPAKYRLPLQIAGGAPAGAALGGLGVVGGGAAFGALQGADQPASNLKERARNTVTSAALSVLLAKGGELAGKGIANVSARTGLTDFIAKQVGKVSPEAASTMGTRGQVNDALASRQDILDEIGSNGTAGRQQLDRIAKTKAQAKVFYDKARADQQIVDDPELNAQLSDPQVKKAFKFVADMRAAKGNPLPTVQSPANVPPAAEALGISPKAWANSQRLAAARGGSAAGRAGQTTAQRLAVNSGVEGLPPELSGPTGVSMPDPEALSQLKQHLWSVAQGKPDTHIGQQEAYQLIPKVDAIRNTLHAKSPAWAKADAFYADAKGQEEAFANGFDAIKHANNVSGENLPEASPEAMLKAIEEPRYRGEPPQARARRAEAFREGMKAFTASQIKGQTVDKGASSALGGSALEPTQSGAQLRQMMMGSPAESNSLERTIAQKRGASMSSSGVSNISRIPVSARGLLYQGVRKLVRGPDLLQTPEGQGMLSERLANEALQAREISNFRAGTPMTDEVKRALSISAGAQAAKTKRLTDIVRGQNQ